MICLITSIITDRTGLYEVLLPVNHNYNNTTNSEFFASSEKRPFKCERARIVHANYLGMTRTLLLHCPFSGEIIRTVDSQSDLRILL